MSVAYSRPKFHFTDISGMFHDVNPAFMYQLACRTHG